MIDTDEGNTELNYKLAKMLYQTGAWISVMDQEGGHKADGQELDALYKTLRKFSYEQDYRHLKPIFDLALSNVMAWPEWARNLSDFTQELREIEPQISLELRQCFYDLAYSVAIRYRERSLWRVIVSGLSVSLRNFISPETRQTELGHYIKISPSEKNALNELAEILHMPQRVIK